jgi:1-acyl-sn-glycerol-3-phosphate acyltransferase
MTTLGVRIFIYSGSVFLRTVLWFYGLRREKNRSAIPRQGGLLILANHKSYLDPPIVQIGCPRHVWFMAKQELFDMRFVGWVLRYVGAFPVKQNAPDRAALNRAIELLKAGETVCIFPEGGVNNGSEVGELQGGAALIVRRAQCQVICCGLKNTEQLMGVDEMKPKRASARVEARWGEPRSFDRKSPAEEILGWASSELNRLLD